MTQNILIIGNHCCSNRGDAAILRGLLEYLGSNYPDAAITTTTRYLDAAQYIIPNQHFITDQLFGAQFEGSRVSKAIKNRLFTHIGLPRFACNQGLSFATNAHREFASFVQQFDLVIQVGGSFFVDLYGIKQYEAPLIVKGLGIPYVIIGHSVGPFQSSNIKQLARASFDGVPILLREQVSLQHFNQLDVKQANVIDSADTAWLVTPRTTNLPKVVLDFVAKPTVAITLRDLKPFDVRLGITQKQFEDKIMTMCNSLSNLGYQIIAVSTCTGLDGYHKDDRMVALNVQRKLKNQHMFMVVMDELNDVELGHLLSKCQLTIGTRLHSAIISMNFGTPAYAIAYEHKSEGILNQMQLADFSIDIHDIDAPSTFDKLQSTLSSIETTKSDLAEKVMAEKQRACSSIEYVLQPILN